MSVSLDRKWMTFAERLSREEQGLECQSVYYTGGGVYRVSFGARVRGASLARAFLEETAPNFSMRVSHAAGTIDRTNGGGA